MNSLSAVKPTFRVHKATVCLIGFGATFAGLVCFELLVEIASFFVITDRFEFRI